MRLFILGATGGIGRHLLTIALERGHHVTAYVRSPEKISIQDRNLKVLKGDLFDAGEMAAALPEHDVVLSAFGPTTLARTTERQKFGQTLALALQKSGLKKVQLVSSAFLFHDVGLLGSILRRTIFRQLVPDMVQMEKQLTKDNPELLWTIVRPPRLTDAPARHKYRVAEGQLPRGGLTITRADVAEFMIDEAEKEEHVRCIVGVAN